MTLKADMAALRASIVAEYVDFPNPRNDPVVAFEARAAEIIGDLAVFAVRENNERLTPNHVMVQGFAAILSIVIEQIASHGVAPEYANAVRVEAVRSLSHYLGGADIVSAQVPIPTKDVGDA